MKQIKLLAIIFTITVFCFNKTSAQDKTYKIFYSFYESYGNDDSVLKSDLMIDKNSSLFEINDRLKESDEEAKTTYDENSNSIVSTFYKRPEANRAVYKNYTDDFLISLDTGYYDNFYYIKEKNPDFGWKIENETKENLGYQCQKATMSFRTRNYTAWFAPDIPVSDGPWKFNGLPGLILQIEDDKGKVKIEATKIILNPEDNKISFEINKKYPVLSWEEYTKTIDKEMINDIKVAKSGSNESISSSFDVSIEKIEYYARKKE